MSQHLVDEIRCAVHRTLSAQLFHWITVKYRERRQHGKIAPSNPNPNAVQHLAAERSVREEHTW